MADLVTVALDELLPRAEGPESRLTEAMRYAALSEGKRLRTFFALETGRMFDLDERSVLRAACALECIHAYSLIHDDLPCMDDDDLRRGRPTVHIQYDEMTAVLAGDALQAAAFEILAHPDTHPDGSVRAELVTRLAVVSAAHPRRMRASITDRRQVAASAYLLGYQRPWVPERQLVADDAAHVAELLRSWSATPGWPDPETESVYRRAMQIEAVAHSALEYYRWAGRSLLRPDGLRYARRMRAPISRPVLHLHGARDPAVRPSTAAGSGRYVAGPYSWSVIPDAGHFPHEEAPQAVTAALVDWLRR